MRILHTSDWHIGKRLMGRERLVEQAEVLDEIIGVCEAENIELVLVAGDIFDTYTPSAEAEELFYSKIKKIAGETRAVLLISGNHDDGIRLSAASPLAEEYGIYIVGNDRRPLPCNGNRKITALQSGKGYAVFGNGKERIFVSALPYPNEARFKEEKSELDYISQIGKWIEEGESGNIEKLPSVFMGHLFVLGGEVSDGEREIDLGGARAIPVGALPKSDYIALGHLHKKQKMGQGHCYYSGSPLQYAFDERADKSVKVFDLTVEGVVGLKEVELTKGKKLVRLEADSVENALTLLKEYPNSLVELTLHLSSPLTNAQTTALAMEENLVSLIPEISVEENLEFSSRKGLSDEALFTAYYRSTYGKDPKPELKTLFLETLAKTQEGK